MAQIVLGIGTSHSPVLSLAPEMWEAYAQNDKRNPELLLPDGTNVPVVITSDNSRVFTKD